LISINNDTKKDFFVAVFVIFFLYFFFKYLIIRLLHFPLLAFQKNLLPFNHGYSVHVPIGCGPYICNINNTKPHLKKIKAMTTITMILSLLGGWAFYPHYEANSITEDVIVGI